MVPIANGRVRWAVGDRPVSVKLIIRGMQQEMLVPVTHLCKKSVRSDLDRRVIRMLQAERRYAIVKQDTTGILQGLPVLRGNFLSSRGLAAALAVEFFVDLAEVGVGDVRVDLGRVDGGVAKE